MGILTDFQSLSAGRVITEQSTETVSVHIPVTAECSEPNCGYDEVLGGALDPSCAVCDGTGLVTTWRVSHVMGRVMEIDPAHIRFVRDGRVMTGEVGDVAIQLSHDQRQIAEKVKATDGAYFWVDNRRLKPESITLNRAAGVTSVDVRCFLVRKD